MDKKSAVMQKISVVILIAVMGFLNPVFGVILSAIILNEGDIISYRSLIALLLVCIGICVVYMKAGSDIKKIEA